MSSSRSYLGAFLAVLTIIFLVFWKPQFQALHQGQAMGTSYQVKWLSKSSASELTRLKIGVDKKIELVDQLMSTYLEDSELSRFNNFQSTDWFPISSETLEVVREAKRVFQLSDGAFDPSLGPLVELWGFGADGDRFLPPDERELSKLLPIVGFEKLRFRENPPALKKTTKLLQLDLSGIAKGYAVDIVTDYLTKNGVLDFLVEIGGELRASGNSLSGQPWKIAIERPSEKTRSKAQGLILLKDMSMATSGNYRNFFDAEGKRYSHTISPGTGQPVSHNTVSVTVFARTCIEADTLATAMMVLGAEKGLKLAEREELAVLYIRKTEDGFKELPSELYNEIFGSSVIR